MVKDVPPQARLMQEEIFGPLLPIVTISDVDDAIHFISEREKPLAIYVFSSNKKVWREIVSKLWSKAETQINPCDLTLIWRSYIIELV